MKEIVVYANAPYQAKTSCVACIGYFDGLHIGHQKLIEKTVSIAKEKGILAACICFDNDPWIVMKKVEEAKHITPHKKRMERLQKMGIECCYVLHFDESMMQLGKEAFIKDILYALQIDTLVCGEDFHFGAKGKGSITDLKQADFALEVVNEVKVNQLKVSSSYIEKCILTGKMEEVTSLLGDTYKVDGIVVHGSKVGKKLLGFPTANLKPEQEYIIPKKGVYAGTAIYKGKTYRVMINIGHNPTMNFKEEVSIEGYLLDFDGDLYGKSLCFSFDKMIREEKRFASTEELITQLHNDVAYVATYKG